MFPRTGIHFFLSVWLWKFFLFLLLASSFHARSSLSRLFLLSFLAEAETKRMRVCMLRNAESDFNAPPSSWNICLAGFRSIQLRNGYSEELELSTLLVHIDMCTPFESQEEEDLYGDMQSLNQQMLHLNRDAKEAARGSDSSRLDTLNKKLQDSQGQLQLMKKQMEAERAQRYVPSNYINDCEAVMNWSRATVGLPALQGANSAGRSPYLLL